MVNEATGPNGIRCHLEPLARSEASRTERELGLGVGRCLPRLAPARCRCRLCVGARLRFGLWLSNAGAWRLRRRFDRRLRLPARSSLRGDRLEERLERDRIVGRGREVERDLHPMLRVVFGSQPTPWRASCWESSRSGCSACGPGPRSRSARPLRPRLPRPAPARSRPRTSSGRSRSGTPSYRMRRRSARSSPGVTNVIGARAGTTATAAVGPVAVVRSVLNRAAATDGSSQRGRLRSRPDSVATAGCGPVADSATSDDSRAESQRRPRTTRPRAAANARPKASPMAIGATGSIPIDRPPAGPLTSPNDRVASPARPRVREPARKQRARYPASRASFSWLAASLGSLAGPPASLAHPSLVGHPRVHDGYARSGDPAGLVELHVPDRVDREAHDRGCQDSHAGHPGDVPERRDHTDVGAALRGPLHHVDEP